MVRTSTAENNNYICPACGDDLKQNNSGKGFVHHKSNPNCTFEKGEKDASPSYQSSSRSPLRTTPIAHQITDGIRVCGWKHNNGTGHVEKE